MNSAKLTFLCIITLIIVATLRSQAQSSPLPTTTASTRPSTPDIENLIVHPSPTTRPWMQYRLLPDATDLTEGNAVTLYLLARRSWPDQQTTNDVLSPENAKYNYLDTPTDQFPLQYAKRLLDAYADTLSYADLGARRRDAIWNTGWRERGFTGPYPFAYLSDLRHVENLLSFRGRLQVSQNNWAAAQYTMQSAFAIAQHVGTEPLLLHGLVEAGFAEVTLRRSVEEWVSHPDSPNLYWPLTDLPHPFVNLRNVSQGTLVDFRHWKPPIAQALGGRLPANQWPQLIRQMIGLLQDTLPPYKRNPAVVEADANKLIESAYPRSRQYLLSNGIPPQAIDAMSKDQVVGTYLCQQYRTAYDELWKAFTLPYPQAAELMLGSWRAIAPDQSPAVDNPLFQAALITHSAAGPEYRSPNVLNIRYQLARTDRLIALFRTIEAIRDYAGHHQGRAPETLDQITDLPVPVDPVTGKAFGYRVQSEVITLEALAPAYQSVSSGWRYQLTFQK